MSPVPGTRLGPYEITGRLGEGGMGEVYRATDTRLRREVAIKVLPKAFSDDAERLSRFEREAQLLAQLQHPNIASIYGLEDSDGVRALVMELVEGPTLADRLESGPLPIDECLAVARQIAEALEEAHEKGIVHRDLKPQNVKAAADGKVKVLDFGLAKAMDPVAGSTPSLAASPTLHNSPTLTAAGTQLGVILGTAAYMAPEQARGGAVDKRADIWAFGVVLYEMLSGRAPFLSDTVADTLAAVLTRPLDWQALPAATPPGIRRLLRRCLERQPRSRLRDIGDARIVIEGVIAGDEQVDTESLPAISQATQAAVWRRWVPWLGGALAGAVLGTLAAPRTGSPAAQRASVPPAVRMLVASGQSAEPDVSPDGKTLAFTSERNGETRIWIKDLASGSESALARAPSWFPRFSPDGTSVLFSSEEEGATQADLYRTSLTTREERLVARDAASGDWSPDGRRVSFLRRQQQRNVMGRGFAELVLVDLESGEERVLHRNDSGSMTLARWSPDGLRIAVSVFGIQIGSGERLLVVDVGSGAVESLRLEMEGLPVLQQQGICWLSPGRLALLLLDSGVRISQSGRIATLDLATGELTSVLPLATVGWGLDVAGEDSLVFGIGSLEQNLREVRRSPDGWSEAAPLTEGPFSDRQPVYSPDGRFLLFSSNRSGNIDIWRLSRETGELRRLTDHEAADWDPALSPDGAQLLFSSNRTGLFQIWIADADGASPRQVTDLDNVQNPSMTADGAWIVLTRQADRPEESGLWRIRPDGSDLTQIAAGNLLVPETSPDGRFVAFRSQPEDGRRIVRVADGRKLDVSIPFTDRYRWSVEAGETYLWTIVLDEEAHTVARYPLDPERETLGAATTILSGGAIRAAESLGVARDGSAVAFSSLANRRAQLVRVDHLPGLRED